MDAKYRCFMHSRHGSLSLYFTPKCIVMKYITDKKHKPDRQEKQSMERAKMEKEDPAGSKPTKVRGEKKSELPQKEDTRNKWDGM